MRLVVQRVSEAKVEVEGKVGGEISHGLLILVGIEADDMQEDVEYLAHKAMSMRIFNDDQGKMNLDVQQVSGQVLVISQFTLHASTRKGNRPSFIRAATPSIAIPLFESFCTTVESILAQPIQRGIFGAHMMVTLCNDGPVTIVIDSKIKDL